MERRNVVFSEEEKSELTRKERLALMYYRTVGWLQDNWLLYCIRGLIIYGAYSYLRVLYTYSNEESMSHKEIRFYVYTLIVVLCIVAFSVLRIYNAIVNNTLGLYKLKDAMNKNIAQMKEHETVLTKINQSMETSFKKLSNTISELINKGAK